MIRLRPLKVIATHRSPLLVELLANDLLLLEELDGVPESHASSGQEAGAQHQDRRSRDRSSGPLPAARESRPEGAEDGDETGRWGD